MSDAVHQTEELLFSVLLQLIVMIAAARIGNTILRRLGQPGVVGEILAGLVLGPSLFGHFFPETARAVFGAQAPTPIIIISQIGLILLMFQIGMDFEFEHLKEPPQRACRDCRNTRIRRGAADPRHHHRQALGCGAGAGHRPHGLQFVLRCGLAITAVPVLGRMLREYGLTRTEVGVVAISAAAVNDVMGWLLLAGISAYAAAKFSGRGALLQLGALLLFVLVLWFVLRPLVARLLVANPLRAGGLPANLMAVVLCLLFATGICTYQLGIFAIFGGFAAGLLFHRYADFVHAWHRQVGRFVLVFFLPVFFTFTGLRTNVLGLGSAGDLTWLLVVLAAAALGKILPVYGAARLTGFDNPHGWILGALMNTRGLMELIVLNIGLELGFIPPKVFTILVIMAITTTLMTGPLLKLLLPRAGHVPSLGTEA